MQPGGDFIAAEVNAVLALVAPDYIPVPSGDPIALALRVIAERLTGMVAAAGGDQTGATFNQLSSAIGPLANSGDPRMASVTLLFKKYGDAAGVPNGALLSPLDNRVLLSPIDGRILLKRAA